MEQLLDVKIVPISFELKVHPAKLEESSDASTQQGIVDYRDLIPYTPKLYIDTREFRNKTERNASPLTTKEASKNDILLAMGKGTGI